MDCRRSAVLFMALLFGACGCTSSLPVLRLSGTRIDPDEMTHKAPTYVAFGDFRARTAEAPENTPAARDQLREEAKLAYFKAIEVDPKYLPAYVALARVQSAAEDHATAVQTYTKALAMSPSDASLWFELGMCQCRMKDWPSAVANMRKGMELDPNNRQLATGMGLALARAGQWDQAFTVLARVNGQAKAHYDLARMLKHVNQAAQARQHAEAAVAADPRFEAARTLLNELDKPAAAPAPAQGPVVQQVAHHAPQGAHNVQQAASTQEAGPVLEPQPPVSAPPSQPAPEPAAPATQVAPPAPVPQAPVEQPKAQPAPAPMPAVEETPMPQNLPESVDRPIRVPPLPIIRIGSVTK